MINWCSFSCGVFPQLLQMYLLNSVNLNICYIGELCIRLKHKSRNGGR
jgi:hypothetical protein